MNAADLIRREFALRPGFVHLNHAALGVFPQRTVRAVRGFAEEFGAQGSLDFPAWMRTEKSLRDRLAWLIDAPDPRDVALLKNTSEGLSFIAAGLPWQRGENVVTARDEFISNRIPWEALRTRGVEVRYAAGPDLEGELESLCDRNTRLLTISSVQFGDGRRMDMDRLAAYCRSHGILLCVDAIQSLGVLPLNVQEMAADFVVAGSHKWLLGAEGLAVFYCRAELRERLRLSEFGWHMVQHAGDFDRLDWEPAGSARRFECGSVNRLGICALEASLSLFQDLGMEEITRRVLGHTRLLIRELRRMPDVTVLTPDTPERHAGIVTFTNTRLDSGVLKQRLEDVGILCATRSGGIRLSPHFHTSESALEFTLATIRRELQACG